MNTETNWNDAIDNTVVTWLARFSKLETAGGIYLQITTPFDALVIFGHHCWGSDKYKVICTSFIQISTMSGLKINFIIK